MLVITGASGFIGKAVVEKFYQLGMEILPLYGRKDLDLTNTNSVKQIISAIRPKAIIHLAGQAKVAFDLADPLNHYRNNVVTTANLLEAAPQDCRFVLASSATVYGPSQHPRYESDGLFPSSPYAVSKLAAESLVKQFTAAGKVRGVSLRLIANTGLNATHGLIRDIVNKLKSDSHILNLLGEKPGSCKPLLHTNDTVSAILAALSNSHFCGPVNICTSDPLTVEDVANTVMQRLQIWKEIHWLGKSSNWIGDDNQVNCANALAYSVLGWRPELTSREAVEMAVDGY